MVNYEEEESLDYVPFSSPFLEVVMNLIKICLYFINCTVQCDDMSLASIIYPGG